MSRAIKSFLATTVFCVAAAMSSQAYAQSNCTAGNFQNLDCKTPIYADSPISISRHNGFLSQDRRFILTFQDDGNVVLYQFAGGYPNGPRAIWSSNTRIPILSSGEYVRFQWQTDGNLVAYSPETYTDSKGVVWASGTAGRGNYFEVQNDGNAVIRDINGNVLWATNTCCR